MSQSVDEAEHSIEMHLPYLRHVFRGFASLYTSFRADPGSRDVRIVPILVGATSPATEVSFGALLAPYLADTRTLFVISSDFCHWGSRFSYTRYCTPTGQPTNLRASTASSVFASFPISKSIEALDREGMDAITLSSQPQHSQDGLAAHRVFTDYLERTKSTVCGRHPISVLLATIGALQGQTPAEQWDLSFVRYEQSSACVRPSDSSVSYASAVCRRL